MKNSKLTAILAAFALLLLPMVLSSCEDTQESSAAPSSSQAEPTQTPTATPHPTPSATPEATPQPTSSPTPEATLEHSPAGEFEQLFQENAIDKMLKDEIDLADSSKAILRAYGDAEKHWRRMINITYKDCQEILSGDQLDSLQAQQETWEAELEDKKTEIAAEYGDDINEQLELSEKIVSIYREQGKVMCQAYYQAVGEMPDFEVVLSDEPLG